MAMLEPLRIELSMDELALLRHHLGTAAEPELDAERLASATEALHGRGLMNVLPGGGVQLDDVVGALLGTCTYATFSIVVHQASPRGTSEWSVHYAAEMAVEQRHLGSERYAFTAFPSAGQLLDRLASELEIAEQPRPAGELIALERTALQAARDAATTGTPRDSADALQADHVPAESAHSIAQLLATFAEVAQLTAFQQPAPGAEPLMIREILLLRGPSGFWGFVGPVEDSDALYAAPMSGLEVRLLLIALLSLADTS